MSKGDYTKAEPLFFEAKKIREKNKSKTSPLYAQSLNNLGVLYSQKGDYSKAELLYLEAVAILAKALGKEHPDYAHSLNNLASLYGGVRYEMDSKAVVAQGEFSNMTGSLTGTGSHDADFLLCGKDIWNRKQGQNEQKANFPFHWTRAFNSYKNT